MTKVAAIDVNTYLSNGKKISELNHLKYGELSTDSEVDFDDYTQTGIYDYYGHNSANATNAPVDEKWWGTLIVLKRGNNFIQQIFIGNYAINDTRIFLRSYANSRWYNWTAIA